jgi:antitoxin component YwqK of YwqJK toxin-antitoxin module
MSNGEVRSIGEHNNDVLDGLGRVYYRNDRVEDGVFKRGELNGIGVQYSKINNKYMIGGHKK